MQVTRGTDYGVRVMCHLASMPLGTRVKIDGLAEAAEVPKSFLSKILQRLVGAGLIHSQRGADGGFELARSPASISLLDVVTALEGPLALNSCLMATDRCHRQPWCPVHLVWAEAQVRMAEVLSGAKLDKLATDNLQRRPLVREEW